MKLWTIRKNIGGKFEIKMGEFAIFCLQFYAQRKALALFIVIGKRWIIDDFHFVLYSSVL